MAHTHGYLRGIRDGINDQLEGFTKGPLRLMDIDVSPPKDVSAPYVDRLKAQLAEVEELMVQYGVPNDA